LFFFLLAELYVNICFKMLYIGVKIVDE